MRQIESVLSVLDDWPPTLGVVFRRSIGFAEIAQDYAAQVEMTIDGEHGAAPVSRTGGAEGEPGAGSIINGIGSLTDLLD